MILNKTIKQRFIKPLVVALTIILILGILVWYKPSNENPKVQVKSPEQSLQQLAPISSKWSIDSLMLSDTNELQHKFYSEAYLFHNLSLADGINKYCARTAVANATALANCNTAAKMSNPLYLGYFALSDDYARPNVLMLLGMVLFILLLVKLLFKGLYLNAFSRRLNPGASFAFKE